MIVQGGRQSEAHATSDVGAHLRLGVDRRTVRGEQAFALGLSVLLCLAAAVTFSGPWAKSVITPSFPFAPIATTWAIFDLLTACFLFARFYVSGRPLFGWVGAAYGCCGLLTISYLAAYLGLLGTARHTVGDQQVAGALYIAWHTIFAALIPIGVVLDGKRFHQLSKQRASSVVGATLAAVILASALLTVGIVVERDHLPIFALNGVMEPALAHAMHFIVGLSGVSLVTVLLLYRERLYGLPLWLSVALLTSMLEAALNSISPRLFSIAWDLGKVLTLSTASFVMIQTLVATVRMYAAISEIMALRTQDAGARLRAIWRIATSEGLGERDHLQFILDVATATLRARHNVYGFTSQLEEGRVRIVAASQHGDPLANERAAEAYRADRVSSVVDGLSASLLASGMTVIWATSSDLPEDAAESTGWRTAIGTVIRVGAQTHFLVFGTPDRLEDERFGESDVAFVEVVASVINRRYFEHAQLKRIEFQSEHDALTGVYNRTLFRRLGRVAWADQSLRAIILINLDGFSDVNHRLGQMTGDDLLVEVAASLESVDRRDVIARISGDEFAVLVQSPESNRRDLAAAFRAYERVFRTPFATGDREAAVFAAVSASLGIAVTDDSASGFEPLLSRAAVALERSKNRGGNTVTFFGPELQGLFEQRSVERAELVEALRSNALFLEYQPTFELNTMTLTGAEALVRWKHPTKGVIHPDKLLPTMRRANLLSELTFWVMRQIANDFANAHVPETFRCFFNVPSLVLETESFVTNLNQILFSHPEFGGHLGIEVTESEVMHNVEHAIESLGRARQLGLLVAVDDFGTGYSSLNYLKRLPVDVLKLDKSFIQGLPDDHKDVALAELFLALSKQFGFVSLGEGIETEAQAEWLRSHGCIIGQGFLYAKPMPHGALMNLIRASVA